MRFSARVFAISNAFLALTLLVLLIDLMPHIEEAASDEPIRLPLVPVLLFSSAAVAIFAWTRTWQGKEASRWLIATLPAAMYLVVFFPLMWQTVLVGTRVTEFMTSALSLVGGVIAVLSGVVAFREASSGQLILRGDARDTRMRILGGIVLISIVGPAIFFLLRPKASAGGGPGGPAATQTPSPGTGVTTVVLAQGNLPLPQGTLVVSVLQIRQPTGDRIVDKHDGGFVYVIEGEQQLTVGTKQQTLRPGSAAYIAPGEQHEHLSAGTSPCRWLFLGARATDVSERDFKFGEQSVLYKSGELPSLPAGANSETLSTFALKPGSNSFRYQTGGVTAFFVLAGEVRVEAGTGQADLKEGQGWHLLSGTPFTLTNRASTESRLVAFVLAPEGSRPITQVP